MERYSSAMGSREENSQQKKQIALFATGTLDLVLILIFASSTQVGSCPHWIAGQIQNLQSFFPLPNSRMLNASEGPF